MFHVKQIFTKNEDTIAAIITPFGVGAVSVIRVSGTKTFEVIDKIFVGNKYPSTAITHTLLYGELKHNNEIIDDVLLAIFKSPYSYTGEDSVEINLHGNPIIAKNVIELLLNCNIRLAQNGEFTKRAYLNGKMNLVQAEAVAEIISARTKASLHGARQQLGAYYTDQIVKLRNKLIETTSLFELELDFAEDDIEFVPKDKLGEILEGVKNEISMFIKSFQFGKILKDGVNVAIVGEPNVGKSSLLNLLLKENRAIVTDIPGTTRDSITEEVDIDGILFKFTDTAGIRETSDVVEKIGVEKSYEILKSADIVLVLYDMSVDATSSDLDILDSVESNRILKVGNKLDISKNDSCLYDVAVSIKNHIGIESLIERLKQYVQNINVYSENSIVVTNVRHKIQLEKASDSIDRALKGLNEKFTNEYVAVDIRYAVESLSEIVGEITTDDILNNIFSKFCIGK